MLTEYKALINIKQGDIVKIQDRIFLCHENSLKSETNPCIVSEVVKIIKKDGKRFVEPSGKIVLVNFSENVSLDKEVITYPELRVTFKEDFDEDNTEEDGLP